MKKTEVRELSYDFALNIIQLYKELTEKKEFILSKQLLRSGTSIGANIREANNTNTLKDFVYKLNIAQKECDESIYWLDLLKDSDYISSETHYSTQLKAQNILNILKRSIMTTKEKYRV